MEVVFIFDEITRQLAAAQEESGFWDDPGAHLPSLPQGVVDAAAGFGDGVFSAITLPARHISW